MALVSRVDKVSDKTAKMIVSDILNASLGPGDMLPSEAKMMEAYGVSRASLREALRILEVNGVVRIKAGPGGGPVIGSADASDFGRSASLFFNMHGATMLELIEARTLLEPTLARRAAEQRSDESITAMRATLATPAALKDDSATEWISITADFHIMVSRLANNKVLSLFSDSLAEIQSARIGPLVPMKQRAEALEAHAHIGEAIIAGDGDSAEHLMRSHLEALSRRLRRFGPGIANAPLSWL